VRRPLQDFGFTPTNIAGGKSPGELGGVIWRDYPAAWYADRVGRLSLDEELTVHVYDAGTGEIEGDGVYAFEATCAGAAVITHGRLELFS